MDSILAEKTINAQRTEWKNLLLVFKLSTTKALKG